MIPLQIYKEISSIIPILCIDLVIKDEKNKYLLARRKNEPLKNQWWIIGGRIFQGETALDACIRKIKEELGQKIENIEFLGYYEEKFDKNSFQDSITYHTVSLVFQTTISREKFCSLIKLDEQHSEYGWFDELPKSFLIKGSNSQMKIS